MTLERLDDKEGWGALNPCLNREHEPPQHIVLRPGTYRHTCPGCGHTRTFTVRSVTC